MIIVLCRAETA